MPDKKNTSRDGLDAQIVQVVKSLSPENLRQMTEFVEALLYDRDHPGANTAERLREKLLSECGGKEETPHAG